MAGSKTKTQRRSRKGNANMAARGGNGHFFKSVQAEMKKVVWPTKNQLINYTIIVLIAVAFVSVLIAIFDGIFSHLFQWLMLLVG